MDHSSVTMMGSGPLVVRKLLLTENGDFSVPTNATILHSEIVVNSDKKELLQLWLAVPTAEASSDPSATTVFTQTTMHDEPQLQSPDFDMDDEYYYD